MFSTILRVLQCNSLTKNNVLNQVRHKSSSPFLPQNQLNTNEELKRIVWVDMEMTGLDINKDHILEIACIVTDSDLNIIAEGPNLILHQPSEVLEKMNPWCVETHRKSGLTEASLKSNITVSEAENTVLNFVSNHVEQGVCPLAGNSVYMDRLFIRRLLPRLDDYLHYRIIDVSTVKELCRRWAPTIYQTAPKKAFTHRALDDIKESINELKHYKTRMFKNLV